MIRRARRAVRKAGGGIKLVGLALLFVAFWTYHQLDTLAAKVGLSVPPRAFAVLVIVGLLVALAYATVGAARFTAGLARAWGGVRHPVRHLPQATGRSAGRHGCYTWWQPYDVRLIPRGHPLEHVPPGSLIYVGKATTLWQRVADHTTKSWWHPGLIVVVTEWFPDDESVSRYEKKAIRDWNPVVNVQHNDGGRPMQLNDYLSRHIMAGVR